MSPSSLTYTGLKIREGKPFFPNLCLKFDDCGTLLPLCTWYLRYILIHVSNVHYGSFFASMITSLVRVKQTFPMVGSARNQEQQHGLTYIHDRLMTKSAPFFALGTEHCPYEDRATSGSVDKKKRLSNVQDYAAVTDQSVIMCPSVSVVRCR